MENRKNVSILILLLFSSIRIYTPPVFGFVFINAVTPSSGVPGDTVVVTGTGVTAGSQINLYWDSVKNWDGEKGIMNSTTAKASGAFEVWFDVPEAVSGDHYLWFKNMETGDVVGPEPFVVRAASFEPSIEINRRWGTPGAVLSIQGYNFVPIQGSTISLRFETLDGEIAYYGDTYTVDSEGKFNGVFIVPPVKLGEAYKLVAEQEDYGITAETTMMVNVAVALVDQHEGFPGDEIAISFAGFTPNGLWGAFFGNMTLFLDEMVPQGGSGQETFQVPHVEPGTYSIIIIDYEYEIELELSFNVKGVPSTALNNKQTYWIGETVTFSIFSAYINENSYIKIWDPSNEVFMVSNRFTEDCWVKIGDSYTVAYYKQTSNGNPLTIGLFSQLGEYRWTWYNAYDVELKSGSFNVEGNMLTIESEYGITVGEGSYHPADEAIFSVYPELVEDVSGIHQVFVGWVSNSTDGYFGLDNPAKVFMNDNIKETAQWATQYYLAVITEPGGSANLKSGWYDAGSLIQIEAFPDSNSKFSHWSGVGIGSYSGISKKYSLTMNGPINQTAVFIPKSNFTLSIESEHGITGGGGSYKEGSTISFFVSTEIVALNNDTRVVFSGWMSDSPGGYNGHNVSTSVILTSDITQIALWKPQHFIEIYAEEGGSVSSLSGWYDEGSEIRLLATPNQGHRLSLWNGSGVGAYTGSENGRVFTVNGPFSEIAYFELIPTYHLSISSPYGSISGEGFYEEGKIAFFTVSPTVVRARSNGSRYVFSSWESSSSGGYTGPEASAEVKVDDDIIETALWDTQHLLLIGATPNRRPSSWQQRLSATGEVWVEEGEEIELVAEAEIASGIDVIVPWKFKGWNGDINSSSLVLTFTIDGPMEVYAEWEKDLTRLYLFIGVVAIGTFVVIVSKVNQRRVEKGVQVKAETKRKLIELCRRSEDTIQLSELAEEHGVSVAEVKVIVDEAVKENAIEGSYTLNGTTFVSIYAIKKKIKDHILE